MTRAPLALALAASLLSCAPGGASYTFRIANRDSFALDSATIDGGGGAWRAGSLAPGREAALTVTLRNDVTLHLNGIRGGRPFRVVLGGYAGRGPGGTVRVVIAPGGNVDVGGAASP